MLTQSSAAVMVALMSFTEEDEQGLFTRKRGKKNHLLQFNFQNITMNSKVRNVFLTLTWTDL